MFSDGHLAAIVLRQAILQIRWRSTDGSCRLERDASQCYRKRDRFPE